MITAARRLYVQIRKDSEIPTMEEDFTMVGEDAGTSRDGKINVFA